MKKKQPLYNLIKQKGTKINNFTFLYLKPNLGTLEMLLTSNSCFNTNPTLSIIIRRKVPQKLNQLSSPAET